MDMAPVARAFESRSRGLAGARRNSATRAAATYCSSPFTLQSLGAGLTRADADDLEQIGNEDLSVPDLPRVRGFLDSLDRPLQKVVLDRHLDLDLRQEIDHVLRTAVQLGVTLLPAKALDLGDSDSLDT